MKLSIVIDYRVQQLLKLKVNNGVLYFLDFEDIFIMVLSVLVSML